MSNLLKVISFFIPATVNDKEQKVTDFKLALGAATGIFLIVGAFLTLGGVFELVMESFNGFQISNATIMILLGVTVVWFTLTKIGVTSQEKDNKKPDDVTSK